jgi:hypothetical protein
MRNYNPDPIRFSGKYVPPQYHFETSREEKLREAREKLFNNKAYIAKFSNIKDLVKFNPQDHDWILRSADGDGILLLFDGNLISEEEVNELKDYYRIDQNLEYFSARPIRYHSWEKLSDKRKMASRIKRH